MLIGFSRPSWEAQDSEQIFRLAQEYGLDGVQVKPQQYDSLHLDPDRFKQVYGDRAYLARGGIIVYLGPNYRQWEESFPAFLSFVHGVGGEQICVCANVRESDLDGDGVRGVADVLNELGRQAKAVGATVSLHNHSDGAIFETIDDIERLFAHIDPTYCGLTFDTAHAVKGGIADLAGALERYRSFVNNIHLKDLTPDGAFCPLGTGTVDLQSVIAKLREWDYREWLIVDEETKGLTVREAFDRSIGYLKSNGLFS